MCRALLILLLCGVSVHDVFLREITRPKRNSFEDGWDWAWGYFEKEDTVPIIINYNSSSEYSWKIEKVPEIAYPFVPETDLFNSNLLNRQEMSIPIPHTTTTKSPLTLKIDTKTNEPPFMSVTEKIITDSSTYSSQTSDLPITTSIISNTISTTTTTDAIVSSIIPDTISTTTTTETIDVSIIPNTTLAISTTEDISTDIPNTSTLGTDTTEFSDQSTANKKGTVFNTGDAQSAEIRLANSTEDSPIVFITDPISETTTETKKAESTTETVDPCAPLPGKPDFSAPGRRINEAQCMGYIWELKNRVKQNEWNLRCKKRLFVIQAVGGRITETGEFPHMGAVGWKAAVGTWVFKCGSSLISANFVLTAAHCTKASDKDSTIADPIPKIIRLGDKNIVDKVTLLTSPKDANITNILVHPEYHAPTQYFDIALMELENPVEFTRFIQPACLWNSFNTGEPDHEATLTGWGVIESGSRNISPELQAATVNVLDSAQCDKLLKGAHNRNWRGFRDHQLCAGKLAGGVDSCQGDSGGPLQIKMPLPNEITEQEGQMHYVIGIISFGVGCAYPNLPGVYTRVSSFIDWIEDNVWKNGHNKTYVAPPPSDIISADSLLGDFTIGRR